MSEFEARVKISIRDGEFELSGSELFVNQQLVNFRQIIDETIAKTKLSPISNTQKVAVSASGIQQDDSIADDQSSELKVNPYPNAIHIEGNAINILGTVPGNTKAKQTRATALIFLWAKLFAGEEAVSAADIRSACEKQGCLDINNFAAHLKTLKRQVIINGAKGSSAATYKLTVPGKEEAKTLLEKMNESKS